MPEKINRLTVLGGDARQVAMTAKLLSCGYTVSSLALGEAYCEEALSAACASASAVILPLPYSADGETLFAPLCTESIRIQSVLDAMHAGQRLLCGKGDEALKKEAASRGILLTDYYEDEALTVMNAIPTAEGALSIALNALPVTIHNARITVFGFGRVARVVAKTMKALGAHVTVCARKQADFAWMHAAGYHPVPMLLRETAVSDADLVINTVPVLLLDEKTLSCMRKGSVLIDLASKPGGVDRKAAEELGIRVIWALSLPGKTAPETAGGYLADTVIRLLSGV